MRLPALAILAGFGATIAGVSAWGQVQGQGQGTPRTLWEAPKVGRWSVKAIRNGLTGPAQCYMSNLGEGSGVAFAIQPGDIQRLVIQNATWRIQAGTTAAVQLQVDRFGPWEVVARRSPLAADTIFIDARFDASARRLLQQMREGDWLHIVFPSGESYRVSLEGSKRAAGYLLECYQRFGKVAG